MIKNLLDPSEALAAPPSRDAVGRMKAALDCAGIGESMVVLNGFGPAYGSLQAMADEALKELGAAPVSGEDMLADENLVATGFVGSPDRLFALCQTGYAPVLTHALVGGGAVFPIVHTVATQHDIALCDMMTDPVFGPFATRTSREDAYALLDGVEVSVLRAGSENPVPHGMIGEVVLGDESGNALRTGVLSAFEQVPHRYRAPGLQGWLGFAQPVATVQEHAVHASDIAALVSEHEDVLDARLIAHSKDEAEPILQVETEAGEWIDEDVLARFEALTGLRPVLQRVAPGRFGNSGRNFALMAA
jgi:phenylacetate-CoA ligase